MLWILSIPAFHSLPRISPFSEQPNLILHIRRYFLRYLMLDRIIRIESNRSIIAIKNIALSEDIFNDHFVGHPIMPGALLIETLAQAGTALIEISHRFRNKALLIMVQNAKFRALVRPGDQLHVEAEISSAEKSIVRLEGCIYVNQKMVMNGELTFGLKDADEIYAPHFRPLVQSVYDIWLTDAEMIGFDPPLGSAHV
jgi:3-hydroxyacyl-[acyl-carrier-protein] dehydratase